MVYLQLPLVIIWLAISTFSVSFLCIFRFRDPDMPSIFGHLFSWGVTRIMGVKVVLEGAENVSAHQPCIYTVNHQNAFDLVMCGAVVPRRFVVIGKHELLYIPFFGLIYWASGNITIRRQRHRHAMGGISYAIEEIKKRKISIFIFPEGTRNRTDQPLLPFKKGSFLMAIKAGVPIVPVVIDRTRPLIDWKKGRILKRRLRIRFLPAISTAGMTEKDVVPLLETTHHRMFETFVQMEKNQIG
jgi:1-acyl-sn-glycerol-3-phosphate acyltransferase